MISLKNTLEAIKSKISSHEASIDTLEDRQVYSTSEKVVGTWIDGKPIYRKVYAGTITSHGTTLITTIAISSISSMPTITVTAFGGDPAASQFYNNSTDLVRVYIQPSGALYLVCGTTYPTLPFEYTIILEYTKTTD